MKFSRLGISFHFSGFGFQVTPESVAEWSSRQAHLNEAGNFLLQATDPQTSRSIAEELRRLNVHWAQFVERNTSVSLRTSWNQSRVQTGKNKRSSDQLVCSLCLFADSAQQGF